MPQRVVHRLGFLLGVFLLAIGVFILVRHIHSLGDKYQNRSFTISSRDDRNPLFGEQQQLNPLLIVVRCPRRIYVDESASVSVSAPLTSGGPAKGKFPPLAINLAAAGLNVEPEGWLRLHPESSTHNLVGVWSVRASKPGSYLLVLNPKLEFSDSDPEYAAMKSLLAETESGRKSDEMFSLDEMLRLNEMVYVKFEPGADIPLEVEQRWRSYLSAAWGPVVAFMGSLLTLPGIISFFKDRKREREEKKKQSSVFE